MVNALLKVILYLGLYFVKNDLRLNQWLEKIICHP